jgi:hypothetical protein
MENNLQKMRKKGEENKEEKDIAGRVKGFYPTGFRTLILVKPQENLG